MNIDLFSAMMNLEERKYKVRTWLAIGLLIPALVACLIGML